MGYTQLKLTEGVQQSRYISYVVELLIFKCARRVKLILACHCGRNVGETPAIVYETCVSYMWSVVTLPSYYYYYGRSHCHVSNIEHTTTILLVNAA